MKYSAAAAESPTTYLFGSSTLRASIIWRAQAAKKKYTTYVNIITVTSIAISNGITGIILFPYNCVMSYLAVREH